MSKLHYFRKVVCLWSVFLFILLALAAFANWDQTLIGLTIGIILGFLPSFILTVLANSRSWNVENIEKIYAPLKSEIEDLFIYFSGSREMDPNTLFDYGEIRSSLLSMSTYEQIKNDNLFYRLRLDDRIIAEKLLRFYLVLSFYMKKRMEFFHLILDPIFDRICNQPSTNVPANDLLQKINIAVRNLVLDALEPTGKTITLGFYASGTTLFSDYEKVRIQANISEKTFDAFLSRIRKEIKGEDYDLLLGQRWALFRDSVSIRSMLERKLQQALPT
jgi:uncharacterized membrane-anchored protein YhcB (DUF1043 family)